jgi:uncharacterized protein YuzE
MADDFRVRYDTASDVLYITTSGFGPAHGKEDAPGVFWRYLDADGTLVGVTILDFDSYWKPRLPNLIEQIAHHFHVPAQAAQHALARAHGVS